MKYQKPAIVSLVWHVLQNGMSVAIDCYTTDISGVVEFRSSCCVSSTLGCNISVCGCVPHLGLRARLHDKNGELIIDESFEKSPNFIHIEKDDTGNFVLRGSESSE